MPLSLLLWTLVGVIVASVLALVPGLHIYNVAGVLLLLVDAGSLWLSSSSAWS